MERAANVHPAAAESAAVRRAPTSDWRHASLLYRGLHRTAGPVLAAISRVGVEGSERLHELGDRGAIVAGNHASAWDPVAISAASPRPISWIAKREAFRNPIAGRFFLGIGAIPVDRQRRGNVEAFGEALRAIEEDRRLIGIFPEGTRGPPDAVRPVHTGVARLALLSGAPVVPVGVLCERFLPVGRVRPRFGERSWVLVGEPIAYGADPAAADDRGAAQKVADDVMARVRKCLLECVAARERGEVWRRP